jgi:hypothetical protein
MSGTKILSAVVMATVLLGSGGCGSTGSRSADEKTAAPPVVERPPGRIARLPFRMDMTYSAGASAAIKASSAPFLVQARFYGVPRAGIKASDPLGVILGDEIYGIDGRDGPIRVEGRFDLDLATAKTQGDPRTQVTVVDAMGRRSSAIVCEVFDEALPLAVETGGMIHCKLPGE